MPESGAADGHRKRLRDKFIKNGDSAFADYEILELLLTFAIHRRDVKPVAKSLLAKFKTLSGVVDADLNDLAALSGLGENSAVLIKLIRSMCVRYLEQNIRAETFMTCTENFCEYARMRLGSSTEEMMMVFFMNTKNILMDVEIMGEGTTDSVTVYPSTIAKKALVRGAHSIVLCHNHPGGITKPSIDDVEITREIKHTLKSVDIFLLDHIIVSKFDYYSFRCADEDKPIPLRVLEPLT